MKTLKEIRLSKGVKQKSIADYLGVSRQTYGRYEKHQEKMSIQQAKAACDFLHVDIADIFLPSDVN